jgi:hypothetical protein
MDERAVGTFAASLSHLTLLLLLHRQLERRATQGIEDRLDGAIRDLGDLKFVVESFDARLRAIEDALAVNVYPPNQ